MRIQSAYRDPTLAIDLRVSDLLAQMTPKEKIGQLNQILSKKEVNSSVNELIRQGGVGSRILASSWNAGAGEEQGVAYAILQESQRIAVEKSRLGIPLINGRDVIHGYRTIFPIPLAQAAAWNPELVQKAAEIAAAEARSNYIHWTFAPMLDIARDPRWGRIIEGGGEDPFLCSAMARASVRGFQGDFSARHILACAKHFIGYGAGEGGRDYNTAEISDNTLRNIYLAPFRAAIEERVGTVMSAFNDLNGRPCSSSSYLLTDLLRGELGFQGFVVSDWESIPETILHGTAADRREAALQSFRAGVDMEMIPVCYSEHLEELLDQGLISMEQLNASAARILEAKFRLGLFESPYTPEPPSSEIELPVESRRCARQIASESIVLLKNQEGILPLAKDVDGIVAIGPLLHNKRDLLGNWTLDGRVKDVISISEGLRCVAPRVILFPEDGGSDGALQLVDAKETVIIIVGENYRRTGEDANIAEVVLPPGQEELVEAIHRLGKRMVLIVCSGRPLVLTRVEPLVAAIVWAWHPGIEGGRAIADVVFGDVNPSGKLPVTFPRHGGQIPIYYNYKRTGRPVDDYFGSDSRYQDISGSPLYRFGFGLSYTRFSYSGFEVDISGRNSREEVLVSALLKNEGERAGEEIAQCYVGDVVSSTTRPMRELKGFQRTFLSAGDSVRVTFRLGREELSFHGLDGWTLESGRFLVWIGGDSSASLGGEFTW